MFRLCLENFFSFVYAYIYIVVQFEMMMMTTMKNFLGFLCVCLCVFYVVHVCIFKFYVYQCANICDS